MCVLICEAIRTLALILFITSLRHTSHKSSYIHVKTVMLTETNRAILAERILTLVLYIYYIMCTEMYVFFPVPIVNAQWYSAILYTGANVFLYESLINRTQVWLEYCEY